MACKETLPLALAFFARVSESNYPVKNGMYKNAAPCPCPLCTHVNFEFTVNLPLFLCLHVHVLARTAISRECNFE